MRFIDALLVDIRYSLRRLVQTPAVSLTVVVSIVLVLAANTAIFSLLDAVVLRKVAVASPDRLVAISAIDSRTDATGFFYADTVAAYRSSQRSLQSIAMYNGSGTLPVDVGAGDRTLFGLEAVSHEFFDVAQARAAFGRVLQSHDDTGAAAVVISDRLARRMFPEPAAAVGKSITISGKPVAVIGVTHPGFTGLAFDGGADLWLSFSTLRMLLASTTPGTRAPNLVGRLAEGVSLGEARAEIAARFPGIVTATIGSVPAGMRESVAAQRVQIESAAHGFSGLRRLYGRSIVALMGLGLVLLAVGAVNLCGLLLARSLGRHHAFAVQRALGASGGRLLQQSMLDGVLLACAGLAVALPLAWWVTSNVTPLLVARALPLQYRLTPGASVLMIATLATIAIGLLIGAVPARRALRATTTDVLHGHRSVARTLGRTGKAVLVTQVALAMVLVSGAGLFVTTLANLYANDSQVRTKPIVWTRIAQRVGLRTTPDETYVRALVDGLAGMPGADGAALSVLYPAYLGFPGPLTAAMVAPAASPPSDAAVTAVVESVSPGFFELVGIPRLQGRDFEWTDHSKGPAVGILSQSLAARLFPSADPIGQALRVSQAGTTIQLTVVGVAGDAPIGRIDEPHVAVVYRPITQDLPRAIVPLAHVRVNGDLAAARDNYVAVVNGLGRHEVRALFTVDDWVRDALLQQRLVAGTSTAAAALAVALASIGIFALLAFTVTARVREFGIRMSVGATRPAILAMILRDGMAVVIAGILIGSVLALGGARFVRSLLYGVSAADPLTPIVAALVFIVVGLSAALLPAWRASRVDPAVALRHE
jgi:predicted permease